MSAVIGMQDIFRRLAEIGAALEVQDQDDPVYRDRILRERAVRLAEIDPDQEHVDFPDRVEILTFTIAGERYGFETMHVAQVYPFGQVTMIPGVPDYVVGIVAVEGEVLSVLDLRSLLNLPISRIGDPTAIVVLASDDMRFGILAETLTGIGWFPKNAIEWGMAALTNGQQPYLKGVTADRTGILDAVQLLADKSLIVEIN